ncbi:hypothetical protein [Pseudoclavibacter helvolus]|uniref:Uncharacterized protein n=1 Tax=Pseudoclavibacter helvolus TaxID=255205 RepID=A0A7W4UMJ6_9MICO|nr:hypothetical protein [Pseudoclavibacter helvolus]MBB2956774.1 hypothetical protein [Pseudoclavibacter helvolus]
MDLIAIFDEWAARAALVLGLFATVVALRARRDAGFRKAWLVDWEMRPVGPPQAGATQPHLTITNVTRDSATLVGVTTPDGTAKLWGTPTVAPDDTHEIENFSAIEGLRIQWRRPGSLRTYSYTYRSGRTEWRIRWRRVWYAITDSHKRA